MRVTRIKIETFLVKVAQTQEQEVSCDDCARYSAELVEALLSGKLEHAAFKNILQHLEECIPCAEEFTMLHQCAQMDDQDAWPSFEEMWRKLQSGQ
jgi:hypothetical protein